MLVTACINGARSRDEHPRVPLTAAELGREARVAVDAGAGAVHCHPRDEAGAETLEPSAIAAAVAAIRAACPGVPVGVSTGLWIAGDDPERRLALVRRWAGDVRPDFASVNLSEPGFGAVAEALLDAGIGVEAGSWREEDVEPLAASGLAPRLVRILVEPQDAEEATAVATAAAIERALDAHDMPAARLHHGYGAATWEVLRVAVARGRDIRAGLEDATVLPDGRPATGNRDLVEAAVRLADEG
jgi:uncharacterized protein (DUF849 family)